MPNLVAYCHRGPSHLRPQRLNPTMFRQLVNRSACGLKAPITRQFSVASVRMAEGDTGAPRPGPGGGSHQG